MQLHNVAGDKVYCTEMRHGHDMFRRTWYIRVLFGTGAFVIMTVTPNYGKRRGSQITLRHKTHHGQKSRSTAPLNSFHTFRLI